MIDDDTKLCRLVKNYLSPRGYEMAFAHDGAQGLEMVQTSHYQAVILDVMLPGMDGFEVLRQLRSVSTVPVLMLTALDDESDRIVGLEIGADDYLPKTFSTRELLARLRAVTRRAAFTSQAVTSQALVPTVAPNEYVAGDLRVNAASREAWLCQALLPLTPLEFDLLLNLMRAPNRVLSRQQLLDAVAGERGYENFDRSMDVHISALRRKLGDDAKQPKYIRTVRAAGYLFLPQTEA
ncbi:MAG: response regulator transcription factor [Acidobacteria bacterium]|nr:response regulator transcription factor [Acidobacteriota bacterium]